MKWIFSLLLVSYSVPVWAAQWATVVTEGAIVYRKADFDAPVIGYFSRGQKVQISSKKFGAFHRVRFKQGITGYIADVDVVPQNKSKAEKPKDEDSANRDKKKQKTPASGFRGVGLAAGLVQFTELINKQEPSSRLTFFGLKYTTPFRVLDGPFGLDTTILYHGGAPAYYQDLAENSPTGMIGIVDVNLTFPLMNFSNGAGSFIAGAGPLFTYSSFKARIRGRDNDLTEAKVGVSLTGGLSYKLLPVLLKLEGKYFVEKASYMGFLGSVLYAF